jgi:DNA-binding response OmpR family regulator
MANRKLLLIEDDDLLRKSLAFFLKNQNFDVIESGNGLDALTEIRESAFDLIITDLNIPYVGGLEIINTVRNELQLKTPVIVLTSSGVEHTELEAFDIGASEFIPKPFSPPILKARIEKLIQNSAS